MIRFLFRWLFRLTALGILLATSLFLFKDVLLREWLVYRLRTVTGLEAHLEAVRTHLLSGAVTLSGLSLYNTPEFGGGTLLSIPDLHIEVDRSAILHRELRLNLARLHLAECSLVQNLRGETNVIELWRMIEQRATALDTLPIAPLGLEFDGIDTLNLTLGTLRLVHLGPPGLNRELRIGITNQVLRNVRTGEDFAPLLMQILLRGLTQDSGLIPLPPPPGPRPPAR